ncbi:hypothetical protein [Corynebacterium sp. HMSC074C11]|uniref:hypothetical protein n=1 Tax=Corynebacterium sp. HMSC074C11 TaxID=1715093 RepID=UPI0008A1662D|nr:hypothetical protein [Corynebacterium sp. HMSC074C11]OFN08555.1 hypothetical protein HMPREF2614_05950 [Corynebacterium sp. HMSC074C11]
MAFKSVLRRSALVTVSAASAVALAACGAGQISQTANQHPAVDGAMNGGEDAAGKGAENTNSALGFVNIRDAHILVDPEAGTAGLKFSASNQQRAAESVYTLKSITVEGIGEVELKKVAETPSFAKAAKGENSLPRECQIVAGPKSVIDPLAKTAKDNTGCIAYYTNELDPSTLVGDKSSAAGQNREATFEFTDPQGQTNTYDLDITVSADILEAGAPNRGADAMIESK